MNIRNKQRNNVSRYHRPPFALFLSILLFSLLLLSACGNTPASSGNGDPGSHPTPVPSVDLTLLNQGDTQLQTFQQWIALMQKYGGNVATYQQQYTTDQHALSTVQTNAAYKSALGMLSNHIAAIKIPAMKVEAQNLQQQLQQLVTDWGQKHPYHDDFDNVTYPLGFEYGPAGVGGWVSDSLNSAQTLADYQQIIEDLNTYLTNFQAMATNVADKTPYDQIHQTDLQLMQHYHIDVSKSKVIVVSLQEQAMRVYQNGQLVKTYLVTTGRPERPSPPGVWWVEGRKSPTVFTAGVPQSSPYWYPDTPINYAIQYHSNGYFIHDSVWRTQYGPGTNFPHADGASGTYSSHGSHGCVNMPLDAVAWVYKFVELYTPILVY